MSPMSLGGGLGATCIRRPWHNRYIPGYKNRKRPEFATGPHCNLCKHSHANQKKSLMDPRALQHVAGGGITKGSLER